MKAVVCKEHGPPESLVIEDVPDPEPGPNEVVIDIEAASVNFPDVLIIQGKYQMQPALPFSPGSEVAGTISAVGTDVSDPKPGDRVLAACGYGGFAERVAVDATAAISLPDEVTAEQAAVSLFAYGTSHYALKDRGELQPGETLAVLGAAGGVGLAAVELGHKMGASVIAAASTREKLDLCHEYGADHGINYAEEDLKQRLRDLTDGRGVDVVYDAVGGPYSEPALRATAWKGRFLVIGFAAGDIPKVPLNLTLLKGCSIVGVFWGMSMMQEPELNRANVAELLDWLAAGDLRPHIDARYSLEEAPQALADMADRKVKGKYLVLPGADPALGHAGGD